MKKLWEDDAELFDLMCKELFTAVVGDILDRLGFLHQFLPPGIQPLRDDMVVAGRAMPVLTADYFGEKVAGQSEIGQVPYGLTFHALDDLKPNEVYVSTGGTPRYAMWGELMSTRAIKLGASGAVLHGHSRDTRGILKLSFPTFSLGRYAQDAGARSKVVDYRVPIEIEGVAVNPGDIVFGDLDGVLIVPHAVHEEAISKALEKVQAENLVRQAIEEGLSTVEAFAKYGVM
ncbi:MAG: RraA family protein [Anaerolineaceae bacterium]|nr:MAG: RraA family protein [Anaerolineaceae bacterium]